MTGFDGYSVACPLDAKGKCWPKADFHHEAFSAISPPMTDSDQEQYGHDPDHPIPSVDVLDVIGKLRGGGAELIIVASSAVGPDMRSQHRLLKKIENYQAFILSEEFRQEYAPLPTEPTVIRVQFTQGAHPVITYFLETCQPFLADNGIALVWEGE